MKGINSWDLEKIIQKFTIKTLDLFAIDGHI